MNAEPKYPPDASGGYKYGSSTSAVSENWTKDASVARCKMYPLESASNIVSKMNSIFQEQASCKHF